MRTERAGSNRPDPPRRRRMRRAGKTVAVTTMTAFTGARSARAAVAPPTLGRRPGNRWAGRESPSATQRSTGSPGPGARARTNRCGEPHDVHTSSPAFFLLSERSRFPRQENMDVLRERMPTWHAGAFCGKKGSRGKELSLAWPLGPVGRPVCVQSGLERSGEGNRTAEGEAQVNLPLAGQR